MKEFTVNENYVNIGEMKKLLSRADSSNCETVRFTMDRYCGSIDLCQCSCTIKTKNSEGKSDVVLPQVQSSDDKLEVLWTVSSASTSVAGKLLVQIQFEKIFDDITKNIVWQSNIMEFEIAESLKSADEVYDRNPTLFQQWEERVNTAYSSVLSSVETAKTCSDAAAASVQTAQLQAAAAKADADRAQQTVADFTGYTKQESDNAFAGALIVEAAGQSVTVDDVQPNTFFRSLLVSGQTAETSTGDKSPDHPYVLEGTEQITVTDESGHQQIIALPQPLYSLPDGTADTFDPVSGTGIKRIRSIALSAANWILVPSYFDSSLIGFSCHPADRTDGAPVSYCDRFPITATPTPPKDKESFWWATGIGIAVLKSRLTGWDEIMTSAQKIALFTAWLAANPVIALYKLTKDNEIQGTAQSVPAYSPISVISASGNVAVRYAQDINKVIQRLKADIAALKG